MKAEQVYVVALGLLLFALPARADAVAGGALEYTRDGQSVFIDNSPSLNPTEQITMEVWWQPYDFGGTGYTPLIHKGYTAHAEPHYQYILGCAGQVSSRPYHVGVSACILPYGKRFGVASVSNFWEPGYWYHVAGTYDGQDFRLFVNGQPIDSVNKPGSLAAFDTPLSFGFNYNYPISPRGIIDEVRIWDIARSPADIDADYDRIIDPATPGLVGYWNFDEPDGQAVLDSSPFANHGTLGRTGAVESDEPARVVSTAPLRPTPRRMGDANLDGLVDDYDLSLLLAHWTGPLGTGGTWARGDFEGDGDVADDDLSLLLANWSGPVGGIPEPSAMLVLGWGVVIMLIHKRQRPA